MSEATAQPSDDVLRLPPVPALPPRSLPYVTFGLIGILTLIFVLEQFAGPTLPRALLEPSFETVMRIGGLQQSLVRHQGEWWRMFTGPLLHGGPVHLLMNGLVLLVAGWMLERMVGRLWFGALFVVGGLGGAVGSLFFNPRTIVSVGASGAITGLFAAMLVFSFRYDDLEIRGQLQKRAFQVLLPSLVPLIWTAGHTIDYAAHAFGAITGGIAAFFLSELWPRSEPVPGFRPVAAIIVTLGALGASTGAVKIAPRLLPPPPIPVDDPSNLIPENYLPKTDSDIHESAVWWYVSKYPGDPRSHYYKALFLLGQHDLPQAERELQTALDKKEMLDTRLPPAFRVTVQASLALVLLDEQKTQAAREAAATACLDRSLAIYRKLERRGLCVSAD
ncbi:rhomboid family intramembrane serine protease [Bradyrhizobium sp. HKCCYLS20291]|uniref:rhomboid family intramembrane serine protease n=1 Tax=Bradyrhizobium sp. HKCCYLS20291 TaxID=3420766 RepID=UPI003EBCE23F